MPEIPPTEFPWWARFLIKHVGRGGDIPAPPPGYTSWDDYFLHEGRAMTDLLPLGPTPDTHAEMVKATMVWTRTGEDVATCSMHFVHFDDPATAEFTNDDIDTIKARLDTLWTALKPAYGSEIALDRYEWHEAGVTVRKPNPKRRETILTPVPGTGGDATAQLPPQSAVSVTFKTNRRKSWGRVYLPAPLFSETQVQDGRFTEDYVDDVRTAFGNLLDGAAADSLPMVVWSPRHAGNALQFFKVDDTHPTSAHELGLDEPDTTSIARTVDQVQVDDVIDTIRRRRFDRATVKATHTLP